MSLVSILRQNTNPSFEIPAIRHPILKQRSKLKLKPEYPDRKSETDSIETTHSINKTNSSKIRACSPDSIDLKRSCPSDDKSNQTGLFSSNKFKTEICKNFELFAECKFGQSCFFAHGKNELRSKVDFSHFYKTKLCRNYFRHGFCHYSSRCQYFHLKPSAVYTELFESFVNKVYARIGAREEDTWTSLQELKGQAFRSRLPVFQAMAEGDNTVKLEEGSDAWEKQLI